MNYSYANLVDVVEQELNAGRTQAHKLVQAFLPARSTAGESAPRQSAQAAQALLELLQPYRDKDDASCSAFLAGLVHESGVQLRQQGHTDLVRGQDTASIHLTRAMMAHLFLAAEHAVSTLRNPGAALPEAQRGGSTFPGEHSAQRAVDASLELSRLVSPAGFVDRSNARRAAIWIAGNHGLEEAFVQACVADAPLVRDVARSPEAVSGIDRAAIARALAEMPMAGSEAMKQRDDMVRDIWNWNKPVPAGAFEAGSREMAPLKNSVTYRREDLAQQILDVRPDHDRLMSAVADQLHAAQDPAQRLAAVMSSTLAGGVPVSSDARLELARTVHDILRPLAGADLEQRFAFLAGVLQGAATRLVDMGRADLVAHSDLSHISHLTKNTTVTMHGVLTQEARAGQAPSRIEKLERELPLDALMLQPPGGVGLDDLDEHATRIATWLAMKNGRKDLLQCLAFDDPATVLDVIERTDSSIEFQPRQLLPESTMQRLQDLRASGILDVHGARASTGFVSAPRPR